MLISRRRRKGTIRSISSADLQDAFRQRFSSSDSASIGADDAMKIINYQSDQFKSLAEAMYIYGVYPFEYKLSKANHNLSHSGKSQTETNHNHNINSVKKTSFIVSEPRPLFVFPKSDKNAASFCPFCFPEFSSDPADIYKDQNCQNCNNNSTNQNNKPKSRNFFKSFLKPQKQHKKHNSDKNINNSEEDLKFEYLKKKSNNLFYIEKPLNLQLAYDFIKFDEIEYTALYFPEKSDAPYLFVAKFMANCLTMPIVCHELSLCHLLSNFKGQYTQFCIAIRSKLPYHSLFKSFVEWYLSCEQVLRMSISDVIENFLSTGQINSEFDFEKESKEKLLLHLTTFMSLPAPRANESIEIDYTPFPYFKWTRPFTTKNFQLLAYEVLFDLVKSLSLKNLLTVFSALMLERNIVLFHPYQPLVANAVLALHFCLRPLKWISSSISVLPKSLVDLLSAPNPFIIGVSYNVNQVDSNVIYVDLENDNVIVSEGEEQLNLFPLKDSILNEFSKTYNEIDSSNSNVLVDLQTKFNSYMSDVLDKICSSIMSDLSDPKNITSKFILELFLKHFKAEERNFMKAFSMSQMVQLHIEQICRKRSDEMKLQMSSQ